GAPTPSMRGKPKDRNEGEPLARRWRTGADIFCFNIKRRCHPGRAPTAREPGSSKRQHWGVAPRKTKHLEVLGPRFRGDERRRGFGKTKPSSCATPAPTHPLRPRGGLRRTVP